MTGDPGRTDAPVAGPPPQRRTSVDLSDLLPRLVSGVVLIVVAIGTAFLGGLSFTLLWLVAALAIHWEWQRLLGPTRMRARIVLGWVAIVLADVLIHRDLVPHALGLLVLGGVAVAVTARSERTLSGFGVLYAGALPVALALLRSSDPFGLDAILWLFAVVWGTDVFAYFGGRFIGGPKLWPRVSPSKTWSGFLVGVGSGAIAGWLLSLGWGPHWALIPLGVAAGVIAQAGDFFESALKRRFGVKDSSRIIPGHGGVLDRLDGFLTASVFAASFGILRFGVEASGAGLLQW